MRTKAFVSTKKVAAMIILLAASVAATALLTLSGRNPYAIITAIAAAWSAYRLISMYTASIRKATFMFNAIDNGDYSFNFSIDRAHVDDVILNQALNRIKEILENARRNVMEREKYYELIMDSVRTGIVTLDDSGSVYQVNGEALRVFGIQVFTHVSQLNLIDPVIAETMFALDPGEKRQLVFHNERGEVAISLTASAVTLQDKSLKIIAVSDINNELAEKELESWMRLTRILTHEIMNSLAPITSLSDTLISAGGNRTDDTVQGLKTIKTTSKSLMSFVESYRKFTNIPLPNKKLFSLKTLFQRAASLQSGGNGVRLSIVTDPDDTLIYADEDQAGQVVINVLKNAVQAVSHCSDPVIEIASHIDESENIVIEISNNGGAIPAEIAENIFMPFFTTKKGGSGIGLSVSRQIMRLHGGSLRLTSNTDRKVTFTLQF